MERSHRNITRIILGVTLLFVLPTIVYYNHFGNAFHFDDGHTIVNNPEIRDLKNIGRFFGDGTTFSVLPQNQSYRPIVSMSLAIDYWLGGGLEPFYFHLSTFMLFLFQGVLMYILFKRVLDLSLTSDWNTYFALAFSGFYLLHPANAETVNYVIARSDVQSTVFLILSFALYIVSPLCRRSYLYLLPLVIGALAKPPTVMFFPIFFLYVAFFEERLSIQKLLVSPLSNDGRQSLYRIIRKTLPALIVCASLYLFVDKMTPANWTPGGASRYRYLITQPYILIHYVTTFFLPIRLSADGDWQALEGIGDPRALFGIAFLLLLCAIIYTTSNRRESRPISFGLAWFLLALLPTSSIIPLAEVQNDHRIFFPFVGLTLSVGTAIVLAVGYLRSAKWIPAMRPAVTAIVFAIALSGYGYGSVIRNSVWRTEDSLWKDVTEKSPKNGRGLMNYGVGKMAQGDYKTAEIYFLRALKYNPNYGVLHTNLGIVYNALGDIDKAEGYFRRATIAGADMSSTWLFYGNYLKRNGRYPEAISAYKRGIQLAPSDLRIRVELLDLYKEINDQTSFSGSVDEAVKLSPNDPALLQVIALPWGGGKRESQGVRARWAPRDGSDKAISLEGKLLNESLKLYNEERFESSIIKAYEALQINQTYAEAFNNICAANAKLERWDEAITACAKALEIKPDYALAKGNMAWALSGRGG